MRTLKTYSQLPSENEEQRRLIQWFKAAHPNTLFYAVPNGGRRDLVTAAKLKATGVKPGVPDLVVPVPKNGYHGLYIELKRVKGGQLSQYQNDWITKLKANGYKAEVCAGADAAMAVINAYLQERIER
jgi:hypothetical protein